MSRKEKVNHLLDILKGVILALMSALFAVFGYVVVKLYELSIIQALCCLLGVIILGAFFYFAVKHLKRLLDELEEL